MTLRYKNKEGKYIEIDSEKLEQLCECEEGNIYIDTRSSCGKPMSECCGGCGYYIPCKDCGGTGWKQFELP